VGGAISVDGGEKGPGHGTRVRSGELLGRPGVLERQGEHLGAVPDGGVLAGFDRDQVAIGRAEGHGTIGLPDQIDVENLGRGVHGDRGEQEAEKQGGESKERPSE
jgi:hypothetical protein